MAHVKLDLRQPQSEASPQQLTHAPKQVCEQTARRPPKAQAEGADATAPPRPAHDFSRIPVLSSAPLGLQAKLDVGAPDDAFEREADSVAERVMRAPEPRLQRACGCGGRCSECQPKRSELSDERLQTKSAGSGEAARAAAPPSVEQALAAPGRPLDAGVRAFFEPRFGHDFSRVRVHADADAGRSARAVNAHAYTVGRDIVFGAGRYAPGTHEGQRLLAHELAHVIQQTAGATTVQRDVGDTEPQTNEPTEPAGNTGAEPVPMEDPPAGAPGQPPNQTPAAPGPKCAESINWTPKSPIPVDITADTAASFVSQINTALGGNPHTEVEPSFDAETTDGKITKVNFTLKTAIRRPRYGGGRASAEDKALIGRIVDFIKAHEERHRDLARAEAQQAVCDALGQPAAKGQKTLNDAICKKMPTVQEQLDASEGKIELTSDQKDFKATGVKVNYHDPTCK